MAEPYTIKLTSAVNFDGATLITLTRADLTADGRLYSGALGAAGGVIHSDFFGLYSPTSTKIVGIAFSSFNPLSVARVLDATGRVRQELNLTGDFQYVLLHAGDKLAVETKEQLALTSGAVLTLVVNETSEGDHMAWALAHPPTSNHTRFRIVRTQGAFAPVLAGTWVPAFEWDPGARMLVALDNVNNAPIPIAALSPWPRQYGTLITIRYAGSADDGKLNIVESSTRNVWVAQSSMTNVRWSAVQYAAHDDMIMLEATPDAGLGRLVCDIEVVRVEPGDRLRERFAAPEVFPIPGPGNNL